MPVAKNTSVVVKNVSFTGTFTVIRSAQGQPIETSELILQGITGALDGAGAAFLKVTAVTKPKILVEEFDDVFKPILQVSYSDDLVSTSDDLVSTLDDYITVSSDDWTSLYSDDLASMSDDFVTTISDDMVSLKSSSSYGYFSRKNVVRKILPRDRSTEALQALCSFPWYITVISPSVQNLSINQMKLVCVLKTSYVVKDALKDALLKSGAI